MKIIIIRAQTERSGVFSRVQLPQDQPRRQPLLSDFRASDNRIGNIGRQPLHHSSRIDSYGNTMATVIRYSDHDTKQDGGLKARYNGQEKEYSNLRMMYDNKRHQTHADRIMRGRDNKPREARYGGSRYNTGPYDRKGELAWREKPWSLAYARKTNDAVRDVVPYEQVSQKK